MKKFFYQIFTSIIHFAIIAFFAFIMLAGFIDMIMHGSFVFYLPLEPHKIQIEPPKIQIPTNIPIMPPPNIPENLSIQIPELPPVHIE